MVEPHPAAIRGYICRGFAEHIVRRWGTPWVSRAAARLPPEMTEGLDLRRDDLGFVPSRWYPAHEVHALLDLIFEEIPEHRQFELAGEAGRHVFTTQLQGFQRTLFALILSPNRFVRHAPKAWAHNFRTGEVSYETGPRHHTSTYRHWQEHHPIICRGMMVGRLEVYAAMGLENARVSIECCDPERGCRSTVYWGAPSDGEPDTPDASL